MSDREGKIIDSIICGGVCGLLLFAAAMIIRGAVILG